MIKNYYTYGQYGEALEKVKRILELIHELFIEININSNDNYEKKYKVSEFNCEKKMGVMRVINLEEDLNKLKKNNLQKKQKYYELLYNNPQMQLISNMNLYNSDINDNDNDKFSNINEKNNKVKLDKLEEEYESSNNISKEITNYKSYILKDEYKKELRGFNFYKTEEKKNEYEIDILKIFNLLLEDFKLWMFIIKRIKS